MLTKEKIIDELKGLGIAPPRIIFYNLTDSTNTRAKEWAKENPENREPVIFIANGQTAGRGRLGRSFVSEGGAGIYMSILSYPTERGSDATAATARAAVSLCRAIESLCECEARIKWVNDVYLGSKKLAGILTEGEMDNECKIPFQVVGMGINVYKNAISGEISDIATSLEDEVNCPPKREKIIAGIIKEFLRGADDCYAEYRARSFVIGRSVRVIRAAESYEARVIDINRDYSLQIERGGVCERLFSGEISIKAI